MKHLRKTRSTLKMAHGYMMPLENKSLLPSKAKKSRQAEPAITMPEDSRSRREDYMLFLTPLNRRKNI
jgi:hypothetical protein